MAETHYQTLGLKRKATEAEIKGAYRKLVLKYHPDKSSDPNAEQIFIRVQQAFEVLSDPIERARYDEHLDADTRRTKEREATERQNRDAREKAEWQKRQAREREPIQEPTGRNVSPPATLASKLTKLSVMFSRQQFGECERLAREILREDSGQALPYAILADISRARGHFEEAAQLYSYALQMDPKNPAYLKRYEEIIERSEMTMHGKRVHIQPEEKTTFAMCTIIAVGVLACVYVVLAQERPFLALFGPVSSWTLGLTVMLFLCGVSSGAAMAVANLIDRVDAFSGGRMAPAVALGLIALVSYPAAGILYLVLGSTQRAFNLTTTRLMLAVGALTFALALSSFASSSSIAPGQVLLWGGNVVYMGALCGWTVADSFRG